MVGTLFLTIFFFFIIHGQIETVHVCNIATWINHFMKFPVILVQVYFYSRPPPPTQPPILFHGFIRFMKFLSYHDYYVLICWDLGSTRFNSWAICMLLPPYWNIDLV